MELQGKEEQRIIRSAAEWIQLLERPDPQTHQEFIDWVSKDKQHLNEFLELVAIHVETGWIKPQRWLEFKRGLEPAAANIIAWPATLADSAATVIPMQTHRDPARRWRNWTLSLAASLAGLVIALGFWIYRSALVYTTAVGESRILVLEDGSTVQMNTRSRIRVRHFGNTRDVELLQGEAIFQVAPDPVSPFRVMTETAVVQAVGTQFNVYRQTDQRTLVSVVEGKVKVYGIGASRHLPVQLAAGDRIEILDHANATTFVPHRLGSKTAIAPPAWTRGKIVLNGDRLSDAALEFNRYTSKQLVVNDRIARLKVNGVFASRDVESFVAAVTQALDLHAKCAYATNPVTEIIRLEP